MLVIVKNNPCNTHFLTVPLCSICFRVGESGVGRDRVSAENWEAASLFKAPLSSVFLLARWPKHGVNTYFRKDNAKVEREK